jgi:hypothetical protein
VDLPAKPRNVVNPRIDVRAQFAFQRLFKRPDPADRQAAGELFDAVEAGEIQGIYGDDLGKAVELAKSRGTDRWELVPKGKDAILIQDGLPGSPVVVFKQAAGTMPRLDRALLDIARGRAGGGPGVPGTAAPGDVDSGQAPAPPAGQQAGLSPRFAGDKNLQDIFDGRKFMFFGWFGCSVKKVQQALIEAGFDLPEHGVDGDFRTETRAAVIGFQSSESGLDADGGVGRDTLERLQNAVAPEPVRPIDCTVPPRPGDPEPACQCGPTRDPTIPEPDARCGTNPRTGQPNLCLPGGKDHPCGFCQQDDRPPPPPQRCPFPACDSRRPPGIAKDVWDIRVCGPGGVCIPRAGQVCGCCNNAGGERQTCHDKNEKAHQARVRKCKDAFIEAISVLPDCFKSEIECIAETNPAAKAIACAEAAVCFARTVKARVDRDRCVEDSHRKVLRGRKVCDAKC